MRTKWALVGLTVVLSAALMFSGCGTKPAASGNEVLTIAVDDTYPPMEYRDEKNELVGFDIDFAKALGEKMGKTIEFKSIAWDTIFAGLDAGNYDAIISSVSMTPTRLENYEFTKPYLANGQVIVVKPGDTSVTKVEDLAGKIVGVQIATTADEACAKQLETMKFELKQYDEIIQTFEALNSGNIECVVVDYAVAIDYATKYPDKYVITSTQLTNEPISICIKKGNTALRDEFQKALTELQTEGKMGELSKTWFGGKDFTSNIDENLY